MHVFSTPLTQAKLLKRYKRFLADVVINQQVITVHCPNTGAMTGCQDTNSTIFLSHSTNKARKYAYTWEYATDTQGNKICVNTTNANKLIKLALKSHLIAELALYGQVFSEQKVNNSRIDFLLKEDGFPDCYVEVKSVTLAENSVAMFPDTITKRGQKHCYELATLAKQGFKAVMLFCVMRENIEQFKVAKHIDLEYAEALNYAIENGVNVLCYGCLLEKNHIKLSHSIPIVF